MLSYHKRIMQWKTAHKMACNDFVNYYYYYYYSFTAPWTVSRTTRVSQYQKGKTNLDLLEQEIVSGSGISWVICKSAPRPRQNNHASIPPGCSGLVLRPSTGVC